MSDPIENATTLVAQNYGNMHILFLQTIMEKTVISLKHAALVLKDITTVLKMKLFEKEILEKTFYTFIMVINKQLKPFNLEIKRSRDEDTSEIFYVLVNTIDDDISKMFGEYTNYEIEYFQLLINRIFSSDEGQIETTEGLNIASEMQNKWTPVNAEKFLKVLKAENWIKETKGILSLGVRNMAAFEPYYKSTFPDIYMHCHLCETFILRGETCNSCETKIHHHCSAKYFEKSIETKCPKCQAHWPHIRRNDGNARMASENQSHRESLEPERQSKRLRTLTVQS